MLDTLTDKASKPIITQCKESKTYKEVTYGENTFGASANFGQGTDASFLLYNYPLIIIQQKSRKIKVLQDFQLQGECLISLINQS